MSTRFRAIVIATIASVLFLLATLDSLDKWIWGADITSVSSSAREFTQAFIVSLVIAIGTFWVLFFKRKGLSLFSIGIFPAVAIFPYMLFTDTIISSFLGGLEQVPAAIIASLVFLGVCYLLILTANVLNGSVLYSIPLGQAGKASQFVFSLISSYLLIAYLFGGAFSLELRLLLIGSFSFYFAYSGIWALQVSAQQVWLSSGAIALVMVLLTGLLSVWPIPSIYATIVAVVFLYIMLNVALEMREYINRAVWLEYGVLLIFIVIILFTLGEWGINGTII